MFFCIPKNQILEVLQDNFKILKDINISIKNTNTLEVSLTERKALYTWCGASPTSPSDNCYFVDENGYIFDQAPYFSGEVYFKFYGPMLLIAEILLVLYFSQQHFQQLISFKNTLVNLD